MQQLSHELEMIQGNWDRFEIGEREVGLAAHKSSQSVDRSIERSMSFVQQRRLERRRELDLRLLRRIGEGFDEGRAKLRFACAGEAPLFALLPVVET